MMKKKCIWGFSFLFLLMGSCAKEEIMSYDVSEHSLYIPVEKDIDIFNTVRLDTALFSFRHYAGVDDYDIRFLVRLAGKTLEEDRTYSLKVVEDKTTASPEDYTLATEQVFHAGVWEDYLTITLHRTPHLSEGWKRVTVQLVPNDNFLIADYIGDSNFSIVNIPSNAVTVLFSDLISKPDWWDDRITDFYLGEYSDRKYERFIEATGVSDLSGYSSIELVEIINHFKDELAKHEGDPYWQEENGDPITVKI